MNLAPRHAAPLAAPLELAARYANVRQASVDLSAPLTPEDCQVQSMADASPTKWHLAHTTWFFETFLLEPNEAGFAPFDPSFRVLFNSYYQGVGEMHPRALRGLITRPTLAEVMRYRAAVDERMLRLLDKRGVDPALAALLTLGLHHEQQHQELLLTDIKHALAFNPTHAPYAKRWPMTSVRDQPLRWFAQPGGLLEHGFDAESDGDFCFDNETPRHGAYTAPFELASRPVNHAEYLAFIDDGGYRRADLWLSMGWEWVRSGARTAPLYWREAGGEWLSHTLQGK